MKTISIEETAAFDGVLVDVRLDDDFAASHLPGAVNNCVFEVAFAERMTQIVAAKDTNICVYGAGDDSAEAAMAVEKLQRAGYSNAVAFAGGLAAWQEADRELEGGGEGPSESKVADGRHPIDLAESQLLWVGRNLLNRHWGMVAVTKGWIEVTNGDLSGGEFTLDMNAIECSDLDDKSGGGILIAHLQSDDFFDTERYPEASFCIKTASRLDGAAAGEPNLRVEGELTLKGITQPLSFDAVAGMTDDGKPAAQATLAIDRTLWNVIYGSGKMFHRLGGHLVNDLIELQIKIVAA